MTIPATSQYCLSDDSPPPARLVSHKNVEYLRGVVPGKWLTALSSDHPVTTTTKEEMFRLVTSLRTACATYRENSAGRMQVAARLLLVASKVNAG